MKLRKHPDYLEATRRMINNYYDRCPGSIMPLFLLYLARIAKSGGELFRIEEKASAPLNWEDKKDPISARRRSEILAQFSREDAKELAQTDPSGADLLSRWQCNGMDHMSIVVLFKDARLAEIRAAFQGHDEELGDSMVKRQALFLFVKDLQKCPSSFLKQNFLEIADMILTRANVFVNQMDGSNTSAVNRLHVAILEAWIMRGVKGKVFVPYSRYPYAAALLGKVSVDAESSGPVSELAAMISEIILKGNGISEVSCSVTDKAYGSLGNTLYDGVILDYEAHDEGKRYTSWHKCLEVMKGNPDKDGYPPHLSDRARFVGLIDTKMLFRMVGKQRLFWDIIAKKWLEGIILLPRKYGMALVSVNKAKKNPDIVKIINLYDTTLNPQHFRQLISKNSKSVPIERFLLEQCTLESFFEDSIPEKENFRLVPLGKFLQPCLKTSYFGPDDSYLPEIIYKVTIDPEDSYNPKDNNCYANCEPIDCFSLYEPAFRLDRESLLVKRQGLLCATLYRGRKYAYFFDGLAFSINDEVYPEYLVNELRKGYVLSQLRRWDKGEIYSVDDILAIKIYVPESESPELEEEHICSAELDSNILPPGVVILDTNNYERYIIESFINPGGFGLTYTARNDSDELVVLKEYFSYNYSFRFDGTRVALPVDGSLESMKKGTDLYGHLVKFIEEAKTLNTLGGNPATRLVHSSTAFYCHWTNTWYYTMPFYKEGNLDDYLKKHGSFLKKDGSFDEKELIERIIKPVSVALNTLHNNHWLHLDIKPQNILMDDDGYALIGDLGISQHYDAAGKRDTLGGTFGTPGFRHELQTDESFNKDFHPELDIYSFAMTIWNIISRLEPEELDYSCLEIPGAWSLSDKLRIALRAALDPSLEQTPKSVPEFIHMIPGCEKMKFDTGIPQPISLPIPKPIPQPVDSGIAKLMKAIGINDSGSDVSQDDQNERLDDFT